MVKVQLDPAFEAVGITFTADTTKTKIDKRWTMYGQTYEKRIKIGHTRVIVSIEPKVENKMLYRANLDITYAWEYDLPKRWPANDAVAMVNRAKDEILAKVAATRQAEEDFLAGPQYADLIKQMTAEAKIAKAHKEEQEAEEKITMERKLKLLRLVTEAGVAPDEHGTWETIPWQQMHWAQGSDKHQIRIVDAVTDPLQMRQYLATGEALMLVEDYRERQYSKAYTNRYGPGRRTDLYLVGRNEQGTAFAHAVYNARTVPEAIDWIWQGETIVARNGDVGITPAKRKPKAGVVQDIPVMDNHHVRGEIWQNGSVYARNAVLYHSKGQHPEVRIGNEWHKIVVARRATRSRSSRD